MTAADTLTLRPTTRAVSIATRDGECPALVLRPAGNGPWPAAIFLMDGFGLRQTLVDMAQRLADAGYLILLPDLFYRRGPYRPLDVPSIFARGKLREEVGELLGPSPDNQMAAADSAAFIPFLGAQPDVVGQKIGITGYCMSGAMSLTIAGTFPDRIAVAACFHPGPIVSETESSPHHLVSAMKGRIYVAGAENDPFSPPAMIQTFDEALSAAGVAHQCEVYPGVHHGWTMRDSPLYNHEAAERHWQALFGLFGASLG